MKAIRTFLFLLTISLGVAATAAAAPKYRAAIGGEFSLGFADGLPSSVLASFRLPQFPAVFGLGFSLPENGGAGSLSVMADWWMYQDHLVEFLNFYVGPGLYFGLGSATNFGIRVPVGINMYPIKPLEIFLELAPTIAIYSPSGVFPDFGLQSGFGFRFWF